MSMTLSEMNISFIFLHPAKIESFIACPDNHSIFSRSLQLEKQHSPTSVSSFNVTEVRPLSLKARTSILLMFEKSNCVKSEHLAKQSTGITLHLQFHMTELSFLHSKKAHPETTSIFSGKQTSFKPLFENARSLTFLTPKKSNCIKFEHPKKQSAGITSHWQCHVTDCSLLHPLNVPLSSISIFSVK